MIVSFYDTFFIAEILLEDSDDLVQKGYGWMLKEASKVFLEDVFDFVNKNKGIAIKIGAQTNMQLQECRNKFPKEWI